MLRRAVHVAWSLLMADGRMVSIAMDKGEVTAADPSAITLKRPDGPSVTLAVNGQTKIRVRGGGSLQPGMRAMALSRGGTALAVRAGAKPAR